MPEESSIHQTPLFQGQCHCGRVGFEITQAPKQLVDCNCSICRRLGALWGHIEPGAFTRKGYGATIEYVQGDKSLAIHTCGSCGCTTHWANLSPDGDRMAVNFRMCEPQVVSQFRIRKLDGADTWEFLD
jgi:hypothetical protein